MSTSRPRPKDRARSGRSMFRMAACWPWRPTPVPLRPILTVSSGSIAGAGQSASPATVADATIATPNLTDALTLSGNLSVRDRSPRPARDLPILCGDNSYEEGTTVAAGTLEILSSSALPDGTNLTVAAGGTFIFDPAGSASPLAVRRLVAWPLAALPPVASPRVVASVPEPATFALFAAGVVLFVAHRCWGRKRETNRG